MRNYDDIRHLVQQMKVALNGMYIYEDNLASDTDEEDREYDIYRYNEYKDAYESLFERLKKEMEK